MDRGPAESPPAPPEGSSFELERFTWVAPHLLEVAGTFSALGPRAMAEPFLLVHGPQRSHRLPVLPDSLQDDPRDGRPWGATFAWQEPPVAFETAELRVGPDVIVELPEPAGPDARDGRPVLAVHPVATELAAAGGAVLDDTAGDGAGSPTEDADGDGDGVAAIAEPAGGDEGDPDRTLTMARPAEPGAAPAPGADAPGGTPGGPSPRTAFDLHADLLDAQEENRELRAALQRAGEDLARSRQDLEAERARHDGEVGRFKEGLASVRSMAAEAVAAERAAAEQLGAELQDAQEALRGREEGFAAAQATLRERDDALQEAQTALRDAQEALQDAQDALQARDDALREAYADRDAARADGQAAHDAVRARDEALEATHAERDAAHAEREEALRERDAAHADRDATRAEREAAATAYEQRQEQLVQQITALRDHAAEVEAARDAVERRVAGLETSNRRAAEARDELELAREAADEARLRLERALDTLPGGGAG